MLSIDDLITFYGIPTLVQLSNDDPTVDITDRANINDPLINSLLAEYEDRYKEILRQFPSSKYDIYRLVILELHKRRLLQGNKAMDESLLKEYEAILQRLNSLRWIVFNIGKRKWEVSDAEN